jgi:hypothetical protein
MSGDFGPDFSTGSVNQLFIYNEALGHLGERRLASSPRTASRGACSTAIGPTPSPIV